MKNTKIFFILVLFFGCAGSSGSISGIYQGVIPGADGPGIEMTLYLYPDGRCYSRETYLKNPKEVFYSYPRWEEKNSIIIVSFPEGGGYRLKKIGKKVILLDSENNALPTGAFIYKTS